MGHSKVLEKDSSQDNQEEITQDIWHSDPMALLPQDVGWKWQEEGRKKKSVSIKKIQNNYSESDAVKLERAAI